MASSRNSFRRPPLGVRALNRLGRGLARVGLRGPSLAVEDLLAAARRKTGLLDFGDGSFRPGLERLVASLEEEARLTWLGRIAARREIVALLSSRLGVVAHRRSQPGVVQQQIRRPIFIVGLPRTGTTLLHGLLTQDPAHRSPLAWEVRHPCPPPADAVAAGDPRIAETDRDLAGLERLAPGFQAIHPMGARLPQECVAIQAMEFRSVHFHTAYDVPSYQTWLDAEDPRPAYVWHRRFLQHLQSGYAPERWVLKTPGHLSWLEALFETYPDAAIVQTHRDPLAVLGSLASLVTTLRSAFSAHVDPVAVGSQQVDLWARLLERGLAARVRLGRSASRCFDLRYEALVQDPIASVERIYGHFDLPFTAAARGRMQRHLDANPRDRHGVHEYRLEDFGIDADAASRRFRPYCERFGLIPRPPPPPPPPVLAPPSPRR